MLWFNFYSCFLESFSLVFGFCFSLLLSSRFYVLLFFFLNFNFFILLSKQLVYSQWFSFFNFVYLPFNYPTINLTIKGNLLEFQQASFSKMFWILKICFVWMSLIYFSWCSLDFLSVSSSFPHCSLFCCLLISYWITRILFGMKSISTSFTDGSL